MKIAVTGATGFLGRYIANHLMSEGHSIRCWSRPSSLREGIDAGNCEWISGELGHPDDCQALVEGVDAVVHSALHHPGGGFRGGEGDLVEFCQKNIIGTIQLIESARAAGVRKFVFISTCAVHEVILEDRRLDESHPLWPQSHYGAHKAALEKFVHSYGLGHNFDICALRPTGIYGVATPVNQSKWYNLVQKVANGQDIASSRGGKEVHAQDVARATAVLLQAEGTTGQAYNCYDMYISEQKVAEIAKRLTNSQSKIDSLQKTPKHQIETKKLRNFGMTFGGEKLLEETIKQLLAANK